MTYSERTWVYGWETYAGFLRREEGAAPTSKVDAKTYHWPNFSRKLNENERIWTRGGGTSLALPLRSATAMHKIWWKIRRENTFKYLFVQITNTCYTIVPSHHLKHYCIDVASLGCGSKGARTQGHKGCKHKRVQGCKWAWGYKGARSASTQGCKGCGGAREQGVQWDKGTKAAKVQEVWGVHWVQAVARRASHLVKLSLFDFHSKVLFNDDHTIQMFGENRS